MRLIFYILSSSLLLLLTAAATRADLSFSLTPEVRSGVGTNEIIFTGTLTNTSLTDNLFLNNIQFSLINESSNYLTTATNIFFANVPGILLPGEIYGDVVFAIEISPTTPPGQYLGLVTLQGGTNIFAADDLADPTFEVSLPAPALSIVLSNTNLALSWPSPPGSFTLQQISDLTTTNWAAVTNAPVITNFQNQVILTPETGNQFYRLQYP